MTEEKFSVDISNLSLGILERVVFEFTPGKTISYDGDKLAASIPGLDRGFDKLIC